MASEAKVINVEEFKYGDVVYTSDWKDVPKNTHLSDLQYEANMQNVGLLIREVGEDVAV